MNAVKIWSLQQFNLLQELPQTEIDYLDRSLPMVRFRAGEWVPLLEEREPVVYWLREGAVKIGSPEQADRENASYLVQEGDLFGELWRVDQEDPPDFVRAEAACRICRLDMSTLRYLMERYPRLRQARIRLGDEPLPGLERRLSSLLFTAPKDRVRELLADYFRAYGRAEQAQLRVGHELKAEDMARLAGTSRQKVKAVLSQLQKQGLLDFDKDGMWLETTDLDHVHSDKPGW